MVSLVVTITVESDMPRGEVQARRSLRNLTGLRRLQRLADRFGVRLTHLVTWPAARHGDLEWMARAADDGDCEIGACCQPWCTPPYLANEDRLRMISLTEVTGSAVNAKLAELTAELQSRLGVIARSHRAPFGGLTGCALQALERLGYTTDSSAWPFLDGRAQGGADWRRVSEAPYFPDRQEPERRGSSPVLQVPITVAWDRALPPTLARALAGVVQRGGALGWARHALHQVARLHALDPVAEDTHALKRLARVQVERGLPVLNLPVRSIHLFPGESEAVTDAATVDALFDRLEHLFRYAVDELRATPRTLGEFSRHYLNETTGT